MEAATIIERLVSDGCERDCGWYGYCCEIFTSIKCLLFDYSNLCVDGYGLDLFFDVSADLPSSVFVALIRWHDRFIVVVVELGYG